MSTSMELLNSLTSGTDGVHITVNRDRTITVPDSLKKIAVQSDHNVETVTFDCPRYWDEGNVDLTTMTIYINYTRSDGKPGSYIAKNISVDAEDDTVIHFDWAVEGYATEAAGALTVSVCAKKVDESGNELQHWNSDPTTDLYISKGQETQDVIVNQYPDIVTDLLNRMSETESIVQNSIAEIEAIIDDSGVLT